MRSVAPAATTQARNQKPEQPQNHKGKNPKTKNKGEQAASQQNLARWLARAKSRLAAARSCCAGVCAAVDCPPHSRRAPRARRQPAAAPAVRGDVRLWRKPAGERSARGRRWDNGPRRREKKQRVCAAHVGHCHPRLLKPGEGEEVRLPAKAKEASAHNKPDHR